MTRDTSSTMENTVLDRFRSGGRARTTLALMMGVVVAATAATSGVQAVAGPPSPGAPLRTQEEPLNTHGREIHGVPLKEPTYDSTPAPAPVWPAPGTATVSLAAPAKGKAAVAARAGTLPVRVSGRRTADVAVEVLDRATVPEIWRDGLVVKLRPTPVPATRAAAAPAAVPTEVSVDYDSFRHAKGGDWASRLKLWQLPACALTTPEAAGCAAVPLPSTNDSEAGRVTAAVQLAGASGTTVALGALAAGSDGDYSATPLAESSTWSVNGGFSWSYPMRVPPSAGGLEPEVGLSYSSASVDGRSVATNNQPSWIGEGFEYSPGFIERKYIACLDDMKNGTNTVKTGDQCWRSHNATLSLGGRSTELIKDSRGIWHGRSEDGAVIKSVPDGGNSEHWELTATDGTLYSFGQQKLPGQTATTNSTWTTRVYSNHAGEPCYNADFAKASCDMGWRWNLDYVRDVRGNTISYWYDKETNRYAANKKTTAPVTYVRGGSLRRIDYGTWERGSDISVTPRGQVEFAVGDRCKSNCATHNGSTWPDVPWDLECTTAATTCDDTSPSYWSTKRLASVTTKVWDTSVATPKWQNVDSWTLNTDFPSPGDGTHAGLWLASLVHTGLVGGSKALPPVTFSATSMVNRVLTKNNRTDNWQRLGKIISETGATTVVTYSLPECTAANTNDLAPQDNTMRCFPVRVPNPSDPAEGDITEWWHKYVVTQVAQVDTELAGSHQAPIRNTYYTYGGDPAWHFADDDGFVPAGRRTWSSYRGYATVETRVGEKSGPQTLTVTNYLRGMHGDRTNASGTSTRSVVVDATLGDETVYDEDEFAGMVREQTVYNGDRTKPVSKTVSVPWRSSAKASRDKVEARFVDTRVSYAATALGVNGSRGWRTSRTVSTFNDDDGTVKSTQDDGDLAKTGDEQCVDHTYLSDTTKNLIGLPTVVTTTALTCNAEADAPDDIISAQRFVYDDPLQYGEVTRTDRLKNWTRADGIGWQKIGSATYDAFGRVTTRTDARNITSTTTYEPAGMPVSKSSTVTSAPYSWKTSAQYAPYWGAPTSTTDMLDGVTSVDYDPLGRASKVWLLGWAKAGHETAPSRSFEYTFATGRNEYPSVKSTVLNAAGTYTVGYALYDGFLRPRQTQSRATDGNRIVTDTLYDQYGNAETSYAPHPAVGAPSGALYWTPEWSLRQVVQRNEFDLAGRPTATITLSGDGVTNLVERWRTTTSHEGDLTKVTPPDGGVPTTTVTDAQGRVRKLQRGADDPIASTYTYNRKNQLVETVDAAGNDWTTTYDILGRPTKRTDPDKGDVSYTYNEFDDVVTTTDARGASLFTAYDPLGRRTALHEGTSAAGAKRAEWKYDALYTGQPYKGQLTQSIRYDNGQAYKQQLRSFDGRHQPLSYNYVIPDTEPGLAGTYLVSSGTSVFDGTPMEVTYPAAGGLPTEQVTTRFDPATGLPLKLDTGLPSVTSYVTLQEYTKLGEPSVTFRKINGGEYVQSSTEYDLYTRRVARQLVKPELAAGPVVDRRYEQDPAGNILSLTDLPEVGEQEKQCFSYDGQARLVSAWTPATTADCKTAPSLGTLAGPAKYWTDWTLDKLGNRRTETEHAVSGDTVRTYTYPESGENSVRPHAVTSLKTAVGGTDVTVGFDYDKAGNLVDRPVEDRTQKLTWDAENELTTIVDGDKTTGNLYDAGGERLIRRDSTGTTLFLPGMEIKRPTGATSNTATRYYSFAGQLIASRSTGTGLDWVFTDHQGTQLTTVNDPTQRVTTRRQTPYGAPRGEQPPLWANSTGFVGGTIEPDGLTHLGAREYDPEMGRFISVDPLMDLADPQQWNGYAYANNSPVTSSDPSGLIPPDCHEFDCYDYRDKQGCPGGCGSTENVAYGKKNHLPSTKTHKRRSSAGSGGTGNGPAIPSYTITTKTRAKGGVKAAELMHGATADSRWQINGRVYDREHLLSQITCSAGAAMQDYQLCETGIGLTNSLFPEGDHPCGYGEGVALCNFMGTTGREVELLGLGRAGMGKSPVGGGCNSFDGEARVWMADGSSKAIKDIEVGDKVAATDPETGRSGNREVTATHRNIDSSLTDLTVENGDGTAVIRTTQEHLFWDETSGDWVGAARLDDGAGLLSSSGHHASVQHSMSYVGFSAMYNLTVDDIHTYYVLAGDTPVLVHNTPCVIAGTKLGTLRITAANPSASEVAAGQHMAARGNSVVLRDPVGARGVATSDLLVNGEQWDVYTPTTGNVSRIVSAVASKGSQVQGGGVVIDLSRSSVTANDLANIQARIAGTGARVGRIEVMP